MIEFKSNHVCLHAYVNMSRKGGISKQLPKSDSEIFFLRKPGCQFFPDYEWLVCPQ